MKTAFKFISKKQTAKGFTLIEIMVALTVFSFIMVISMGAILSVLTANHKSQSLRTVMDNVNSTIEDMTRTIRFGTNYHCGGGNINFPQDCVAGTSITIRSSPDSLGVQHQVTYTLTAGQIMRSIDADPSYAVTSPDVTIDTLNFWVSGAWPHIGIGSCPPNDCLQPEVLMLVKGHAGSQPSAQSSFTLQTSVSQRQFDVQ